MSGDILYLLIVNKDQNQQLMNPQPGVSFRR